MYDVKATTPTASSAAPALPATASAPAPPAMLQPSMYHRARTSAVSTTDECTMPRRELIARSVSYTDYHRLKRSGKYQMCIRYRDEALCAKTQENVMNLLQAVREDPSSAGTGSTATEPTSSSTSTNTKLATRALKFRHLLERARQTDVSDPSFDIDEFLHVRWCKESSDISARASPQECQQAQ